MERLKRLRLQLLVLANAVALALVFTVSPAQAASDSFCPDDAEGCDCLEDVIFTPDGCYDNLGFDRICESNAACFEQT